MSREHTKEQLIDDVQKWYDQSISDGDRALIGVLLRQLPDVSEPKQQFEMVRRVRKLVTMDHRLERDRMIEAVARYMNSDDGVSVEDKIKIVIGTASLNQCELDKDGVYDLLREYAGGLED